MRILRPSFLCVLLLGAALLAPAPDARAQATGSVRILGSFDGVTGQYPYTPLTVGNDGNLYGVAPSSSGTVYRVTPAGAITRLHSFVPSTDGSFPQCKLLLATDGNFYGTTARDGSISSGGSTYTGSGTVFRITLDGIFTVLHVFSSDGSQGKNPAGILVQGRDGALYGTASFGDSVSPNNSPGGGAAFRITLDGTFTLLRPVDLLQTGVGAHEALGLIQDSDGDFYGVTSGGNSGAGVVYKMSADGTVTNLHSFSGTDGLYPIGPLVGGGGGVFYGLTATGGVSDNGTYFKVTRDGELTVLRSFANRSEIAHPQSGLTKAADGNFYVTTDSGGDGYGSILQLTPAGAATTVYKFNPATIIGTSPSSALVQTADGTFYSTTRGGGVSGYGTVYRLAVSPHPPFFNGEKDLDNGVEYLAFPNGNVFGYFSFLADPRYLYHFDMGYEYAFDAADGQGGVYLYDFKSGGFFYTSPTFAFPYLYDFNLNAVLYYYPDPNNAGRYNTNGVRYFYNFRTGKIITK